MRLIAAVMLLLLGMATQAEEYPEATGGEQKVSVVIIDDYHAVLDLFEQLHYTDERWIAGDRHVPRLYLSTVPEQWGKGVSHEISVTLKKKLFFRAVGPLVLRSNELILKDRQRLQALAEQEALSAEEDAWVRELAGQYRVDEDAVTEQMTLLLHRVDAIPPSLILAQAAEESGWGTSRFAFAGNALFGQWTWGGKGITPEGQRSGMGDYKIAAFDAPLQSVQAHALNLNSHPAYASFRELRAMQRDTDEAFTGLQAATTLDKYSERGQDYVKSLHAIIKYNKLQGTDKALFEDMHALVLVPADQLNAP